MTLPLPSVNTGQNNPQAAIAHNDQESKPPAEPILCPHCRRTASNGIKCKGICVADSDY